MLATSNPTFFSEFHNYSPEDLESMRQVLCEPVAKIL